MENNGCDVNHLDADVLLPPRKRLLAGMKRQNSDVNSYTPSTSSSGGNEFDTRMNNLLKCHLSNPKLSNEEIVEASRLAAVEASKVARAARVAAEEKAAKAAKAVAAAKSALELVATINEETAHQDKYLKKNKMKKHVAVKSLYSEQKESQNCRTDEELARKLHQVINSSPRILKNASTPEPKNPKLKKLKTSSSEKTDIQNGGTAVEINRPFTSNGISSYVGSDDSVLDKNRARVDLNIAKFKKSNGLKSDHSDRPKINYSNQVNIENGEAEMVLPQERVGQGEDGGISKKKWKFKQKKLPLSICNVRDLESPKETLREKNISCGEDNRSKPTSSSKTLFPVGSSGDAVVDGERTPMWKCQAFKAPACVKQNKVMQS